MVRSRYAGAGSLTVTRPSSFLTRSSIVRKISGCSLRNCLAFSRPWTETFAAEGEPRATLLDDPPIGCEVEEIALA